MVTSTADVDWRRRQSSRPKRRREYIEYIDANPKHLALR